MRRGGIRDKIACLGTLFCLVIGGSAGIAQAQTTPPPQVNVPLPTREEVQKPKPAPSTATNVKIDGSKALETAPCALDASPLNVTINSVSFTGVGNTELPPQIIDTLKGFGPLTQGQQPIRNVCEIRDRANFLLRKSGYIASVQIVPQDMSGGELKLMVVTAHITEVRVHGDAGVYRGLMDSKIAQLQALNPLNEFDAERILLLTGDVPGLDVKLSLRSAGTAPGAVIGDLTISTVPYKVLVNVQNYGSRQVGPETIYARAEFYGLTKHADVTYLGVSSTLDGREQRVVQVGHTMGLGKAGSTIGGSYIYALSRPDLDSLDLRTKSSIFNIEYYKPLVRSLSRDLSLFGGLDVVEQKTEIFSAGNGTGLNLDKLSVAYIRTQGELRRPDTGRGGYYLRGGLEVRQGLDILDASKLGVSVGSFTPSRFDGDPQATVVRFDADGSVSRGLFTAAATLRSQWADKALLSYEEFSVGNLNIGRGYDPGANSADSAIGWRGELRGAFPHNTNLQGEAFAFYDSVHIWNKDAGSTENDRTLNSWGGGLRFFLPGRLVAELMYAQPLDKALTIDRAPPPGRVMFSITTQFVPTAN